MTQVSTTSPEGQVGASPARVGLVVSRAVGSAVIRNQVKRRLRSAMRSRVAHLPSGALVVLRANPAAAGASYAEISADLDQALARAVGRAASAGGGR
jgi:ribonuclease P protein component